MSNFNAEHSPWYEKEKAEITAFIGQTPLSRHEYEIKLLAFYATRFADRLPEDGSLAGLRQPHYPETQQSSRAS